jgi:hypothetical protein
MVMTEQEIKLAAMRGDASVLTECMGRLAIDEKGRLTAVMQWHYGRELTKEFRNSFSKQRCYDLVEIFGHLKGVTGVGISERTKLPDYIQCSKPDAKPGLHMGYAWPNFDASKWQEFRDKFLSIFEVAAQRGAVLVLEDRVGMLFLTSGFLLVEKERIEVS